MGNGVAYSGSTGPSGVRASGTIEWSTDYLVTKGGWKICGSSGVSVPVTTTAAPGPAPTPVWGTWQVSSGPCVKTGRCITSPGYPSNYGNSQECDISITGSVRLEVEAFNTESGYDKLVVNGQVF